MTRTLRKVHKLARLVTGKGCTAADFRPVYEETAQDAWNYTRNAFEEDRFGMIVDTLSAIHAAKALEVGCAEGHLTRRLAGSVEDLLACDIMPEAIERARANCDDLDNIRFLAMDVRTHWPEEMFDLVVYSDVLYFFSKREVRRVIRDSAQHVRERGHLLFANEWHRRYRWFTPPSFIMDELRASDCWECVSSHERPLANEQRSVTIGLFRRVGIARPLDLIP